MVSIYLKSAILFLLIASFVACEEDDLQADLLEGTILFLPPPDNCNDFVIAIGEGRSTRLLKPNNLDDSLKVDSLRIRFAFDSTEQVHSCGFGGSIPVIGLTQLVINENDFCRDSVQLDANAYENEISGQYFMQSATINGNCLKVTFSSSGCDGNSWKVKMVDSEQVLESLPVQKRLRLILENNELCQAVFTRSFYFDLTPTQLDAYSEILFRVDGLDTLISYKY